MEHFSVESCVRGYHIYIYEDIWEASIGEQLLSRRENGNHTDSFAVADVKGTLWKTLPIRIF